MNFIAGLFFKTLDVFLALLKASFGAIIGAVILLTFIMYAMVLLAVLVIGIPIQIALGIIGAFFPRFSVGKSMPEEKPPQHSVHQWPLTQDNTEPDTERKIH